MLIRVLLCCSVWAQVWSQDNHANSPQGSANIGWGWHVSQAGPGTIGHYFVKLPESEQQVRYVADGSGYHGALAVVTGDQRYSHTANFALGQRAIDLSAQIPSVFYQNTITANNTQANSNTEDAQTQQLPVDIYLLQQHYPASSQVTQQTNNNIQYNTLPQFYYGNLHNPDFYDVNVKQTHTNQNSDTRNDNRQDGDTRNLQNIDDNAQQTENAPIVRVFKNHSCLKNVPDTYVDNLQKSTDVIADVPIYKEPNVHGHFGERDLVKNVPAIHNFNIQTESPRLNARNERYYYTTEHNFPTTSDRSVDFNEGGISRLVASTQDLISNDDLLRINYSVEKLTSSSNDDIIKPQRRAKTADKHPVNQFTVTAKYGNIANNQKYTTNNNNDQGFNTQERGNEYRFASPIVVEDPNYDDYKKQIVNNLVSTMVPYIQDGYEIIGVKNTFNESYTNSNGQYNPKDLVAITPRPIGQNYLAPITVALRLFNSNNTNLFNSDGDYDASDSEFVTKTVVGPRKDRVTVEVQESIPVEITHINEVEYHQYLDEGRSNTDNPLKLVKTLYQKYVESLDSPRDNDEKSEDTMKDYSYKSNRENSDNEDTTDDDSKETLEPSENIRSEVQIQGNRYINYYDTQDRGKIIQPIVIEKQVPVTSYIDRYIEKQVPYPEPVEVVKHVPVDRPVPVPVHYERIVEKPVEVTRYVDKPYPVEVLQPYPVEIRVPYPVEHKIYVDRPVHVPYPVEKIIEKQLIHHVPVPTPVAIPVGVQVPVEQKVLYPYAVETPVAIPIPIEKQVPIEKIVQRDVPVPYPVEKRVPYPVSHEVKVPIPYPVEKRIPVPVEKIVEKPVTVTKVVEKPVHIKVPHPVPVEVHVPKPYPVDRIVEKKVPYPVPVDRIIERKVPIKVPYPVKTFVEKIVDRPIFVTKYIDKPYPVENRVPYPVERIVEKRVPYPVEVTYEKNNNKPDTPPYPFEKIESAYLYGHGSNPGYIHNDAHSLNQERFKQSIQSYLHSQAEQRQATQQHAESQRNYQIQSTNNQLQRSIQNMTPVHSTQWGNQYASSFQYINATTEHNKPLTLSNYLNQVNDQRYYGPPPLKNYDNSWNKNGDNTENTRKSDRTPKLSTLRIEYGFKPPMIPSVEVDLDGLPINRNKESSQESS